MTARFTETGKSPSICGADAKDFAAPVSSPLSCEVDQAADAFAS